MMRNIQSYWNRVWSITQTYARDSNHLVLALMDTVLVPNLKKTLKLSTATRQQVQLLSCRDVIVQQARQSNTAALSLLTASREYGLLKYWGPMGYIQQKKREKYDPNNNMQQRESTTTTTAGTAMAAANVFSGGSDVKSKTARIAFMITGPMKKELMDRLGYAREEIKKMKPLEASLILHHDVSPQDMKDRLPSLLEEHQKQIEQKQKIEQEDSEKQGKLAEVHEQQELEQIEENKSDKKISSSMRTETLQYPEASSPPSTKTTEFETSNNDSLLPVEKKETIEHHPNDENEIVWYQVIKEEANPTSTTTSEAVGLYPTIDEAKYALEAMKEFHENGKKLEDTNIDDNNTASASVVSFKIMPKAIR